MSRSVTYRSVRLTAGQRAELAARSRQERFRNDILPTLRGHLEESVRSLARDGFVPTADVSFLTRRVEDGETVEDMREVAAAIGKLQADTTKASTIDQLPSITLERDETKRTERQFDVASLTLEIESIGRTAAGLGVVLPEQEVVRRAARVASELVRRISGSRADRAVRELQEDVAGLDVAINAVLADAECRARTEQAVLCTLHSMGFEVVENLNAGVVTRIVAEANHGRFAQIEISGSAGNVEFASTFNDPSDSVPSDHTDAGAVCESAVIDQLAFQRGMERTAGLGAAALRSAERPTRGAPARAVGTTARRSRQRADTPNSQRGAR
jgi:hypothetical protein